MDENIELIFKESIGDKKIDFVLVYKNVNDDDSIKSATNLKKREIFLKNLETYGLNLVKHTSDENLDFILINTPFDRLLHVAEKTNLKLPIEQNDLEKDSKIYSYWKILTKIFSLPEEISIDVTRDYFTAPYSVKLHQKFLKYFNQNDWEKTFLPKDRIYLTYEILCRTSFSQLSNDPFESFSKFKDKSIGIQRLLAMEVFDAAYPLHDILWEYWANITNIFRFQPIHLVRKYFGEKLAFYFSWLGFYNTCLVVPSIIGLFVFIYGIVAMTKSGQKTNLSYIVDNYATFFFAIFMCVWNAFFIDHWKRYQTKLQFEWDTADYEKSFETIRPEFEQRATKERKNPISGIMEPYVSTLEKLQKYLISVIGIFFMICLVFSFVIGVIVYRIVLKAVAYELQDKSKTSNAIETLIPITSAIINLVFIMLMSRFYGWLAVKLNDLELHETESNYDDALTIKMYLFQFVNYYSSIFYIAFFKGRNHLISIRIYDKFHLPEECDDDGCLFELFIQMAIIMVGKQIISNIKEILIPLIKNYCTSSKNKEFNDSLYQWEKDYLLIKWTNLTLFREYIEIIIQFGFITLFSVAFPLGPLFALINNLFENRIDAFKVLTQLKRPLPKRTQDIGIWISIMFAISQIGIITNGFIISFSSDFIPNMVYGYYRHKYNTFDEFKTFLNPTKINTTLIDLIDFRKQNSTLKIKPDDLKFTKEYYHVFVAQLLFFIIFEHSVFGIASIMHLIIPNKPKLIQDQISKENLVTQQAIWDSSRHDIENIAKINELYSIGRENSRNEDNSNYENSNNEL